MDTPRRNRDHKRDYLKAAMTRYEGGENSGPLDYAIWTLTAAVIAVAQELRRINWN